MKSVLALALPGEPAAPARPALLIATCKSPFFPSLIYFLSNLPAVAPLGRRVMSFNPEQDSQADRSPWSKASPAETELPVHAGQELLAGDGWAVLVR